MSKTITRVFTAEDICNVADYTYRAGDLISGKHEFTKEWATNVIENLRPYVFADAVDMLVGALERQYKEKTGERYKSLKAL